MADRYFVDDPIAVERAVLAGPEAHHLIHVMRAKPGTEVVLFDGSGSEFAARVERVGRADVTLAVLARSEVDRELPVRLTLGVSLPKGDRQRWLVEKAVELGVTRLVPLAAQRSVAHVSGEPPERLRRAVIEASKQCGRNRLMEIAAGEPLEHFLRAGESTAVRWLARPGGIALRHRARPVAGARSRQSDRPGRGSRRRIRRRRSRIGPRRRLASDRPWRPNSAGRNGGLRLGSRDCSTIQLIDGRCLKPAPSA